MSALLVTGAALLGAAAGWAAVPVARSFVTVPAAGAPRRDAFALVGAVVFGGLAARGADPALPALLLVAAAGLVLAVTDLTALRLPDPLVGVVALGGGLGLAAATAATGEPRRLAVAVAGAAFSFTGYALLALLPRARLGFGDVKLAAALGLPLGWLGWPTLRLGLLLPHVLGGAAVLVLLAAGRVRRDTPVPFGPALLGGAWLAAVLT
ncbi:prepilin peptidase [Micromonospora tulbaghiae]|uniref:Leader peptidase (Prepilin peptidase) / N-methyltransferase n=1 Tax=Micromonospora tulbaghiae TaxID=479978 RepID=A0ABY0KEL1_9ACTN|nr:A24 family peptidase [Micromonospora tulbaghiae]MDX5456879.1 A24 family peptidase [Micromonospora tulbaghiae]SCE63851.1 leader peptidase (prepilin peptidase) / N-methyltransferase [Micromonospora tulbaghiae]